MNKIAIQQKIPVIVLCLLIVAMVATLSLQAYNFFAPLQNASQETLNQTTIQPVQNTRPQRNIDQYALFGTAKDDSQQPAEIKTEDLPKTNLRLLLRGVSASSEQGKVSALIEGPDKETLKYSINDVLPGNAKLRSVHDNRIVIERNGRLENLYFPDDVSIGIVRNDRNNGSNARATQSKRTQPLEVPKNFTRPAANLDTLSEQRKQEIKNRLEQLREKMKQAP